MSKKKVLIIDDSPLVLEMAKDILQDAGYTVLTSSNGIEANQHIFTIVDSRPDLIIIDIMMPLLAGDKKAKILKQSEQCRDIPILLLSSKNENELKQLAYESDAHGYICKPFTKYSLIGAVRNYI